MDGSDDVEYSTVVEVESRGWANDPEAGPWSPTVLTLDGHGVRSYTTLLLLRELMHQVWMFENRFAEDDDHKSMQQAAASGNLKDFQDHKIPAEAQLLPCHYFDFFLGSGSGGVIATLLGRMRMTVGDATKAFEELAQATYGAKHQLMTMNEVLRPRHDHRPVESKLESLVNKNGREQLFSCSGDLRGSFKKPRMAHTCCIIYQQRWSRSTAMLCRTYRLPSVPNLGRFGAISQAPAKWTIQQVIRATTPSSTPAKGSKLTNKCLLHYDFRSLAHHELSRSGYGNMSLFLKISSEKTFEKKLAPCAKPTSWSNPKSVWLHVTNTDISMDEWISSTGTSGHMSGDSTINKLKDITNAYLGRTPDTKGSRRAREVEIAIKLIACRIVTIRRGRAAIGGEMWRVFSGA